MGTTTTTSSSSRKPRTPRASRTSRTPRTSRCPRTRWTTRSSSTTTTTMPTSLCYYLCAYLPTILLSSQKEVNKHEVNNLFCVILYVTLVILIKFLVAGAKKGDQSSAKNIDEKTEKINF